MTSHSTALKIAYDELADDARDFLNKLATYRANPTEDAEVELELSLGLLKVHSESASELVLKSYDLEEEVI